VFAAYMLATVRQIRRAASAPAGGGGGAGGPPPWGAVCGGHPPAGSRTPLAELKISC